MQSTSWETLGWRKTQAGIKIPGRNIDNLRYADDTTLMAESEKELKSFLMKVKEETEKAQHSRNKDHGIGPITSWQVDGETVERVTDLILGASKITTDGDYSHVIKRGWEGSWNCNTLATWWEELTYLKRPWCWERLKAKGEGDDREWDGCMASLTQWTWVWVNSGSWWWTGRPGVLWSMGLQRVGHDGVTELNWMFILWTGNDEYDWNHIFVSVNNLINMEKQISLEVHIKNLMCSVY